MQCVAALPNNRIVAAFSDGRTYDSSTLSFWDLTLGVCLKTLTRGTHLIGGVAALPNGRVVTVSLNDLSLQILRDRTRDFSEPKMALQVARQKAIADVASVIAAFLEEA